MISRACRKPDLYFLAIEKVFGKQKHSIRCDAGAQMLASVYHITLNYQAV